MKKLFQSIYQRIRSFFDRNNDGHVKDDLIHVVETTTEAVKMVATETAGYTVAAPQGAIEGVKARRGRKPKKSS